MWGTGTGCWSRKQTIHSLFSGEVQLDDETVLQDLPDRDQIGICDCDSNSDDAVLLFFSF